MPAAKQKLLSFGCLRRRVAAGRGAISKQGLNLALRRFGVPVAGYNEQGHRLFRLSAVRFLRDRLRRPNVKRVA